MTTGETAQGDAEERVVPARHHADAGAVPGAASQRDVGLRAAGREMPGLDGPALVLLVGASGSGKSTLAGRHYRASQVVSLDALRAVVADDECDQSATPDAVGLLKA